MLVAVSFVPRVQSHTTVQWSFWGAALLIIAWQVALFVRVGALARTLEVVLRPQHYVQACVHFSIYAYWGFFWRPVYDHAWLIVAQLLFAYAFDMLLSWSRRKTYVLGFGAFPIVFSTNLFLWFRDDWFYLQFLMIAIGFMGKEFVRWHRDGRYVHIFNPSAFTLGLFSVVLIATGTSDLTWGREIASTLTLAPHIYLYLFAVGLIVMYFFSITLVAAMAAATLFGLSALYSAMMGVPYFLDSEIPTAVFLGLHLLVTDPSTSPRTPLGRALFGVLYGLGVFGLYMLLTAMGAPTFYDKLLCVPLLNLSVIAIDRFTQRVSSSGGIATKLGNNLVNMSIWIAFFGVMTLFGKTDGKHTGDSLPFWQQACEQNRRNGCKRLLQLETTYCSDNSAWACNELGAHYVAGKIVEADAARAAAYFSRSCELRFQAACFNLLTPDVIRHEDPHTLDLRLLLREGGRNLLEMPEADLQSRACTHGWQFACKAAPK
ncbi:MAG TPA: hypothetical protein VK629_01640 [Steroidobacteraceae bacterium]|nr:hypothetical protein [Steroidobacteraceae bacterium]